MIDHVILNVKDFKKSRKFYKAALAPIGYKIIWDIQQYVGFGDRKIAAFWIASRTPRHTKVHVAFNCRSRVVVDRFYDAAIKAGGRDNGAPGVRKHYHPSYYGAFVLDPDGNNIEAVCHRKYKTDQAR
jgi:catechol 2,3-dioxygenase-like lactoylglutathione lyase family enzyme